MLSLSGMFGIVRLMAKFEQQPLFGAEYERKSRLLPMLDQQKDITYWSSPARSVLNGPEVTGMGFWSINPYVGCAFGCAYCYARYAHRYVMERAATSERMDEGLSDFFEGDAAVARLRAQHLRQEERARGLRRTLRNGSDRHLNLLKGETILIGSATDPYQPAERRFRITRGILETLAEHEGLSLHIITKSPLITRDIDVLQKIARRSEISVSISLITLDRELARRLEPRAPTPESRVRALERLRKADIDTSINCMPVLPGITDDPAAARSTGEASGGSGRDRDLGVRAPAAGLCAAALPAVHRAGVPAPGRTLQRRAYARDHEVSASYRKGLSRFFRRTCAKYGLDDGSARVEDDGRKRGAESNRSVQAVRDFSGSAEASPAASGLLVLPEQLLIPGALRVLRESIGQPLRLARKLLPQTVVGGLVVEIVHYLLLEIDRRPPVAQHLDLTGDLLPQLAVHRRGVVLALPGAARCSDQSSTSPLRVPVLEQLLQRFPRAMHAHLERTDRRVEQHGHLLVRTSFNVLHHERFAQ
jgi:DNA repair photolyase